jgi:hypothetical protein
MGGHLFAEIVKISDKNTPAHRNPDTFNVLFPWVGIGLSVGGKLPVSVVPLLDPSSLNLCRSYNQLPQPDSN